MPVLAGEAATPRDDGPDMVELGLVDRPNLLVGRFVIAIDALCLPAATFCAANFGAVEEGMAGRMDVPERALDILGICEADAAPRCESIDNDGPELGTRVAEVLPEAEMEIPGIERETAEIDVLDAAERALADPDDGSGRVRFDIDRDAVPGLTRLGILEPVLDGGLLELGAELRLELKVVPVVLADVGALVRSPAFLASDVNADPLIADPGR